MDFINEKIRVMTEKLKEWQVTDTVPLTYSYIECPEYKTANTPPAADAGWKPYAPHIVFEGVDYHYWLYLQIKPQEAQSDKELRLSVKTGREGEWDATNPQFTAFLNGETVQALDVNHTWIPLEYGKEYDVYLYLYTGMKGGHFEVEASLQTVDLRIEALYYDVHVPYLSMQELGEGNYDYIKIRDCMDKALMKLDLRHVYSEDFYRSVEETLAYLKTEFYEKICGESNIVASCVGHTHIDVAWLWTVAQTREKAQRSFSTVINLIKRNKDYVFMSSQPQLYQHVKESDPQLYEKIKEAVKEGNWEVEGAMWLEADTNLISGESLIRQILYGKRFMKEEFGVESKILWLPDVFGYSGAVPQILRKSGIDKFFTAKMVMSETNKMPNHTFIWQGIDGSEVFAAIRNSYVCMLDPKTLYNTWKDFPNKSLTNRTIVTFGYGDGGGGTTYEMLENYKRLKYGIPGMPKVEIEKAGEYFEKVEKDFRENTAALKKTPKWIGEMYLETHRGTYTSIAKNKKNNRKSELLYLEAETAATADLVLNGGTYPTETIRKNTTNILLNQFHDIIPGSSIKEVYEVTDKEYAVILREGQQIYADKLEALKANVETEGGIFVYNPTSFEITDYVEADGRIYFAEKVPAKGWKVLKAVPAENTVLVSAYVLENDVIRVTFNEKYHITSVYDKEAEREVIMEGEEANCLQVYEDYPRVYDAWEITDYYKQKMWLADDVSKVTLLENGIRVERKYQNSIICQDILLRNGSKRIDFVTEVDWNEDHVLLKAAFPVDIHSDHATYDIQFGNLKRPTHRNNSWDAAKFEVCAHKWADLSEGNYGVSILNDCKYGYSVEENRMTISLLKAATYPNPEADRGHHQFTYSLYPHCGDYRQGGTIQEGYQLNMPLVVEPIMANHGTLPEHFSMVSCAQENVVIEAVKKAEADDSVIVRLYETYDQKALAEIKTSFAWKKVYLCNLMEEEEKLLEAEGDIVKLPMKNFEIVTLQFVR